MWHEAKVRILKALGGRFAAPSRASSLTGNPLRRDLFVAPSFGFSLFFQSNRPGWQLQVKKLSRLPSATGFDFSSLLSEPGYQRVIVLVVFGVSPLALVHLSLNLARDQSPLNAKLLVKSW